MSRRLRKAWLRQTIPVWSTFTQFFLFLKAKQLDRRSGWRKLQENIKFLKTEAELPPNKKRLYLKMICVIWGVGRYRDNVTRVMLGSFVNINKLIHQTLVIFRDVIRERRVIFQMTVCPLTILLKTLCFFVFSSCLVMCSRHYRW